MRCVDALPQLLHSDDISATPSNNVDNTILTYCIESYTHSYVICSVNALVNRPGGVGTYMSRFHSFALCCRPTLAERVVPLIDAETNNLYLIVT